MSNLYQRYKRYKKKQLFQPGILGLLTNPFYAARRGLFVAITELARHVEGRVLDVGCGQKPYEMLFSPVEYIGMEIDSPENRQNKKADLFYDGQTFPFPQSVFDSVVCNQVFEHVFNAQEFLSEVNRVLKTGGTLLLTVPFVWDEHEQPWDFARYTSFGLHHLLELHGFKIISQRKSVVGVRALFQLLNGYIYKITRKSFCFFQLKHIGFLLFPIVNILGELAAFALPNSEDLYLDNIVLAQKVGHA